MKILFVCTGNTCRSPMAEGYLNSKSVYCESRGLAADGSPVCENAKTAMLEIGIDITHHISKQLTADDVKNFDKIICLSKNHFQYLSSLGIQCEVLGEGISDPFGCDLEIYRQCRDEIIKEIDKLLVLEMEDRHINDVLEIENACFSHPWTKQNIIDAKNNNTHFFVYEINNKAVGYVGLSTVLDEGYITNIAVLPEFRKKGIATALLNKLNDFAKNRKLGFISLEVRVSNQNAISLYEKFGYKKEGCRKNFYDTPKEDALILTKRF